VAGTGQRPIPATCAADHGLRSSDRFFAVGAPKSRVWPKWTNTGVAHAAKSVRVCGLWSISATPHQRAPLMELLADKKAGPGVARS